MRTSQTKNDYISIFVNGELYLINYEISIKEYLAFLDISDTQISSNIFEINNKIILKSDLKKFQLKNFAKLELVQVVGGG